MIGRGSPESGQAERVAVKDEWLVYRGCSIAFARAYGLASPDMLIGCTDFDLLPTELARRQLEVESSVINFARSDVSQIILAAAQYPQTVLRTPILSDTREVRGIDIRLLDSPGQSATPPLDYHALIHSGLQATVVMHDGKPLFVNNQAVELFGLTDASDILQMASVASFFSHEDWYRLKRHCDSLEVNLSDLTGHRLVLNAKSAFGQPLVLLVNAQPMDWHGQAAVVLSLVDVGHQSLEISSAISSVNPSANSSVQTPRSLPHLSTGIDNAGRGDAERYQHYALASADFFWETDESLYFSMFKSEQETTLGVPIDNLLGKPMEQLGEIASYPDDSDQWSAHLRVLKNHQPFRDFEFKWQIADDNVKVIRYSGIPVYDNNATFIGYRGTGRDVTARTRQAESIAYHANHDALTGLVNRRHFESLVETALAKAKSERLSHALFFMDLDNFKIVNDTCGHLAGDELLRQLSSMIDGFVRKSDVLGRLGGDEFGVFLYNCSVDAALKLANQIRSEVENFQFLWKENRFRIGVSIGMVVADDRWESLNALFSAADSACYLAKNEGRNQVVVYREADGNSSNRQIGTHWVDEISSALEQKRIVIATQKMLPFRQISQQDLLEPLDDGSAGSLPPGEIQGGWQQRSAYFEVFMRLMLPSGELVQPKAFLPSAVRYGLAAQLDSTVIDVTIDWLKRNPDFLRKVQHCSINLSSSSFSQEGFAGALVDHIRDSGVPPQKLCFELTETETIANLSAASEFMNEMSEIGCRFVLDNFGAGLSSFAYLKDLPVDFLKIDGRLVRDMLDDQIDYTMVKAINEVGQSLGKQTIAEFVENDILLEAVREIGVDFAQGFAVEEPLLTSR